MYFKISKQKYIINKNIKIHIIPYNLHENIKILFFLTINSLQLRLGPVGTTPIKLESPLSRNINKDFGT